MAFRDPQAALRTRIDQLELSLAKTAGRAIRLEEERDALRAELAWLKGDPARARRARAATWRRSARFKALQILGASASSWGHSAFGDRFGRLARA